MKSKAAILWFVVSLALGAALVVQRNTARKQQLKMEELQIQVEKGNGKEKSAAAKVQELESELRNTTAELRLAEFELNQARAAQIAAAQTANSPQPQGARSAVPEERGGGGAMGKMLATMMKDPEMRKALEQQQRMGLEMIYGSLFKHLQLSPDQEQKFRELLLAQQMESMAQAGAMFGGEGDRAQAIQELTEKSKQNQEAMKELLGDEKYGQVQEYNQTIAERMMLEQLGRQADISPDQNEQLLAIILEEKKNVQINRGAPPFDPTRDWQQTMQSDAAAEQIFAQQEEVNVRVLERAAQVLTPDQLQRFGPLLQSQLDMQRAGMKMAREMFQSGNGGQLNPPTELPQTAQ